MKASEILQKYFSAQLLWRKRKRAPLLTFDDLISMQDKLILPVILDVPVVGFYLRAAGRRSSFVDSYLYNNLCFELDPRLKYVKSILELAPDNLFLCGGAICDILDVSKGTNPILMSNAVKDYDIFFCAHNYQEAESVLYRCLNFIEVSNRAEGWRRVTYVVSQNVVTVNINTRYNNQLMKIQFIRRVYQTPDQILMGFDLWPAKHGWNAKIGYFTIPTGAITAIYRFLPIDTTARSLSYGARLQKYINRKGFNAWLPGVDAHIDHNIVTPDCILRRTCSNGFYYENQRFWDAKAGHRCSVNMIPCYCKRYDEKGRFPCTECTVTWFTIEQVCHDDATAFYDVSPRFNAKLIKDGRYHALSFEFGNVQDVLAPQVGHIVDGTTIVATTNHRHATYDPRLVEQQSILNDPAQRWKTKDPGSQYFGSFEPIREPASVWYNFEREGYYVGIAQPVWICLRWLVLRGCWRGMPKDVFNIIIQMILEL